MATDPRRTHEKEQMEAAAVDLADLVAVFYNRLRLCKVPAPQAQAFTETYVEGMMAGDPDQDRW